MAKRTRAEAEAQARELWKLRAQELEAINEKLTRALQVLMRTVHIRAWLNAHDPKAVAQALAALGEAPDPEPEAEAPKAGVSRAQLRRDARLAAMAAGEAPPAGRKAEGWQVLTPEQLATANARLAQAADGARRAAGRETAAQAPKACTGCGTPTYLTDEWTLWPWADGAWLCSKCNDARHEVEEYK